VNRELRIMNCGDEFWRSQNSSV